MAKFVRKDYDKPNRCVSWSGPGFKSYFWEKNLPECEDGRSGFYADDCNMWNVHTCSECGVKTLPAFTKYVDPQYLIHSTLRRALYDLKQWATVSKYVGEETPLMKVVSIFRK